MSPHVRPPSDSIAQTFSADDAYTFILWSLVDEGFRAIDLGLCRRGCSGPPSWMPLPLCCQKL
jgi:hypothetical protein